MVGDAGATRVCGVGGDVIEVIMGRRALVRRAREGWWEWELGI